MSPILYPRHGLSSWLMASATLLATCAQAQAPAGTSGAAEAATPATPPRVQVGDSTQRLLQLQRQAQGAPRPIPGVQAGLSYQRYLESFKHPIPEYLRSTVSDGSAAK